MCKNRFAPRVCLPAPLVGITYHAIDKMQHGRRSGGRGAEPHERVSCTDHATDRRPCRLCYVDACSKLPCFYTTQYSWPGLRTLITVLKFPPHYRSSILIYLNSAMEFNEKKPANGMRRRRKHRMRLRSDSYGIPRSSSLHLIIVCFFERTRSATFMSVHIQTAIHRKTSQVIYPAVSLGSMRPGERASENYTRNKAHLIEAGPRSSRSLRPLWAWPSKAAEQARPLHLVRLRTGSRQRKGQYFHRQQWTELVQSGRACLAQEHEVGERAG